MVCNKGKLFSSPFEPQNVAMDEITMDRVGIDGLSGPGSEQRRNRSGRPKTEQKAAHQVSQTTEKLGAYTVNRVFQLRDSESGRILSSGGSAVSHHLKDGAIPLLKDQGFSTGLAEALNTNAKVFDRRIWIIDNSGSMEIGDGHRIVMTSDRKIEAQNVSRWEELKDTVVYHSEMAALLNSPTLFKLLNHPGPGFQKQDFTVGTGGNNEEEIREARTFMQRIKPMGATPLTKHIWSIQKSIHKMAPKLIREGRRVVVVLATDGLPTDDEGYIGDDVNAEFLSALRSLEGLPIWLVVRLCTDEDKITEFYNNLDGQLELSLEVLDDFMGEAEEVNRHNKWLNYCLPLHRCRELGYHNRVFDFIDERPLTKGELRDFCSVLFGTRLENVPDPNIEWKDFLHYVQEKLEFEDLQWDPLRGKNGPWIYLKTLHRIYGKGKCVVM
jgi:hypothetical protein